MADSDSIWSRGGVPVEQLPDPFAPPVVDSNDGAIGDVAEPKARRRWPLVLYSIGGLLFVIILWLVVTAPLSRALDPLDKPAMLLLSSDGQAIARRGAIKEAPVDVARLDPLTPAAFVAIEDRRFYRHWGVDPRAIGRAMAANIRAGGVREGGSTITQQLSKTNFLSSDRSLKRKGQEVIIALWLEAWLSKDEILSRYMSSVYFGDGVYGLRTAAHHYFGRDPERLTLGQSAMLAGIIQAPSRLAPTSNLSGARKRSRLVLGAMVDTKVISRGQLARAHMASAIHRSSKVPTGTYFADWVSPAAQQRFEADFGEIKIPTTLDSRFQRLAVRAVSNAKIGDAQIALVAMRPSGEVVAMIGGKSYRKSPFNRASQARRQPGSAFKLFVYLAAMRAGWTPDSMIDDSAVTVDGWTPANSDGRYRGRITVREAFARSSNAATVRLAQSVGRANIVRAARDLGVTTVLPDKPSLALGTAAMSLTELTAAYAAIASGRYPVAAHGLAPDSAKSGVFESWFSRSHSLDQRRERAAMLDLLHAAANDGTGKRAALRIPTFGKTGTSQDNRDALFVGFAGDLVVGVWIGRDDNHSLGKISGGTVPATVWRQFMSSALAIDHRQGPVWPRRYGDPAEVVPGPRNEPPSKSPLPPEWSEATRVLREIIDQIEGSLGE